MVVWGEMLVFFIYLGCCMLAKKALSNSVAGPMEGEKYLGGHALEDPKYR